MAGVLKMVIFPFAKLKNPKDLGNGLFSQSFYMIRVYSLMMTEKYM